MKIAFWVLAVLFALFTAVQYNDPDPFWWMLYYGGISVLFVLAALGRKDRIAYVLWLGATLVWMATLLPDFIHWLNMGAPNIAGSMKAEQPHIELTREFLGLLLSALALGWLWRKTR